NERRHAVHARAGRITPPQSGRELLPVRRVTRPLDHDRIGRRLVYARGIGGEHVTLERECTSAAAAAELLVLAAPALPAQRPLPQLLEQGRRTPDVAEGLRAQVTGDFREIGTRRQLAVGRDAAVLRAAGTAGLVVQQRRI